MVDEQPVQLNYVIPEDLNHMLARYCEQNMTTPSLLIRQLILEYVEGDRSVTNPEHPRGRRTTVVLPQRLLLAFESKVEALNHRTKAAVIAALLGDFLPNRIHSGETVRVELSVPTEVFNLVYDLYGPGPLDVVFTKALTQRIRAPKSESVLPQEAK